MVSASQKFIAAGNLTLNRCTDTLEGKAKKGCSWTDHRATDRTVSIVYRMVLDLHYHCWCFFGRPLYFFCRVVIWCRCAVLRIGHFCFSAWKSAFWKADERLSCNRNMQKTKKQRTHFAKQWQCFICRAFSVPLSAFSCGQTALLLSNESPASVTLMLLNLSGGQPGDLRSYFSGIQVKNTIYQEIDTLLSFCVGASLGWHLVEGGLKLGCFEFCLMMC